MPRASRLRPEPIPPAPLRILLLGPARVGAEVARLTGLLEAKGHEPIHVVQEGNEPIETAGPTGVLDAADLVIVFGGDGSILRAARWMGDSQVPVLGINLGRLGFLAGTSPQDATDAIGEVLAGRFRFVEHMMLECELRGGGGIRRELGLNEVSVLAGPPFTMIEIDLLVDGEPATTYRADGLIVSTPAGSTAYNLSAGGPIVRKDLDAFVFTPLSPHTLTNRTVVDSAARTYELRVPHPNDGSACVVDGRVIGGLAAGDSITVRRAAARFVLVEVGRHGYYATLREKLGWGGGLRAATTAPPRRNP
jgi:NAD+ kinase